MKKISFFVALLSASVMSFAADLTNFALASEGSSAQASSGNADLAIDGNNGTRWESASTDDETWTLNMGQARTFNMVKINWEGAFCKEFTIEYSTDGSAYTTWHNETELSSAGWQQIYKETPVTAQYIRYHGTKRATGYGQSFFEFEVYYLPEPPKVYTQITPVTIIANSTGENDVNRVIDGNAGTEWQGRPAGISGGDEASRTFDAWFVVDLGGFYNVDKVDIHFEGACAQDYHIDFSLDNTKWDLGYNYVGSAGINGRTDEVVDLNNNTKVRYVRFWSTKAGTEWGMKIFEFRVYGAEWVDSGDTEAPVMTSATLSSKTWNSVVIAVAATDNHEVVKYHVVDAAKEIDVKCMPEEGKITVNNLTAETAYNFTITALDAANNESANNKVVAVTTDVHVTAPTSAATAPTWDASLVKAVYSPTYNADCGFGEWGGGTATPVNEEYGKKYVMGNGGYCGMTDFTLNCLLMEKLHFDIWIADDATIQLFPIWGGTEQGLPAVLKGGQWNSIDIALSSYNVITDWSNIYQIKIANAANLTFWVGNAYFYRESALVDNEKPTDVSGNMLSASYFNVTLAVSAKDNSGAVSYVVKDGEKEVGVGGGASGATVNVVVKGLTPNTEYTFDVIAKDEANNQADPIQVTAKTLAAPDAAPAPVLSGKVTAPVFCDAIEGNPAINIGGWGQSTVAEIVELAPGDNAYMGTNFNYLGWELAPAVNATNMKYLHVDFYSPNLTSISVTPISPGHEGVKVIALEANKWISADIDLSAYDGKEIAWDNIFQFKFFDAAPAGGELFIDNVYFHVDSSETAIEQVIEPIPAKKEIKNGVLYIIRDGIRYTVTGQVIR